MKEVLLRNSERQSFLRCRLQWWWGWEEGLQLLTSKPALTFGDLVHQCLERYYQKGRKRGPHPSKTFRVVYDKWTKENGYSFGMKVKDNDDEELVWTKARDLGIAMLDGYVEHYGAEDHIEVIVPEMPFRVPLYHPKNGSYVVTAVGKLDAVYRDHSKKKKPLGVIDHKTAASIQTGHLTLDEQAGTYFALTPIFLKEQGLMEEKEELRHILFNFLRKAMPDERPRDGGGRYLNKDGTVSKKQPPPYFKRQEVIRNEADSQNLIQRIVIQAWEMKQIRAGKLPIYKHPTRDCPTMCGFYDVCQLHETGSDWEELLELTTKKWDPHADHELVKKE